MHINREQILNSFLESIACISDQEYQKRVWIRAEGSECDSFDETVCWFFDVGDPLLKDYKNYNMSEAQYHLLIKFRDEFRTFSSENDLPQEFIASSEWKRIMEMAKEVLKAFNYQKKPYYG